VKPADFHFSRRALREALHWGDTQLRVHLERLVDLEYVQAHREGPGGKYVYELVYEVGDESRAQVAGLIDVDAIKALAAAATTRKSRGEGGEVAGGVRGDSGPVAGASRGGQSAENAGNTSAERESAETDAKTHCSRADAENPSYPHVSLAAAGS
jgi:hypothetical protein